MNLGPGPRVDNVPPLPRYIGKEVVCSREVGKVVCCTGAIVVTIVGDIGEGIALSEEAKLFPPLLLLLLLDDDDSTELWRVDDADDDDDGGGTIVDVLSDALDVEPLIDN